jgi:CHAT domain-containing protein
MVWWQALSRPPAAEAGGHRPVFTGLAAQPYSATEVDGWQHKLSRVSQNRAAVQQGFVPSVADDEHQVVLSACNTAAEEKPGAEALSGLARAFFYAGARSLVVSHWEVDDKVAADLMSKMFRLSRENPKLSHGEALQQATLAVLDNARSDEDLRPRLWAPFVVVGEPSKPN